MRGKTAQEHLGKRSGECPKFAWVIPKYHHGNTKYHRSRSLEKAGYLGKLNFCTDGGAPAWGGNALGCILGRFFDECVDFCSHEYVRRHVIQGEHSGSDDSLTVNSLLAAKHAFIAFGSLPVRVFVCVR